jgi:hypothetical protein
MYSIEQNVLNKFSTRINSDRANSALPFKIKTNQQSPKHMSGKFRANVENGEKMFSILDVGVGKTARSFKMPIQYQRPTEEAKHSRNEYFATEIGKFNTIDSSRGEDRNIKTAVSGCRTQGLNPKMLTYFPPHKSNIGNIGPRVCKTSQSNRPQKTTENIAAIDIKTKMQRSDVFFQKESKGDLMEVKGNNRYKESDIFFQKNDENSRAKTGEKYLFRSIQKPYNSISQSNSQWIDKNAYPNLLGHSSIGFHILNPSIKNITRTKQEILSETGTVNKQKSLCEFIDLNRVSCANPNKEYQNAMNNTSRPFHKTANVCGAYLDLHKDYRNLSDRPFVNRENI